MKLQSYDDATLKCRYKIVRLDSYSDVPGEIITADDETGECCLNVKTGDSAETKTFNFGPGGMRIVVRR